MSFDGWLYRNPGARAWLSRLVPDHQRAVSVLGRDYWISTRREIGMWRLAALLMASPTAPELGSLVSLMAMLPRGGTFIDVGANIGLYAVPAASLGAALECRVVAIEPHPQTAARLRQNLAPYPCASVIEAAASDQAGIVVMGHRSTFASATFRVARTPDLTNVHQVRTLRLDALDCPTPWVLKIDVEDHEVEVLAGLSGALEDGRVQTVMLDCFGPPEVPQRLQSLGYTLYDGRTMRPFDLQTGFNLLAMRKAA